MKPVRVVEEGAHEIAGIGKEANFRLMPEIGKAEDDPNNGNDGNRYDGAPFQVVFLCRRDVHARGVLTVSAYKRRPVFEDVESGEFAHSVGVESFFILQI